MRLPLLLTALTVLAGPAWSQDALREPELRLELEASRQRAVAQSNQLMSLEAQLRTDQALRQVEAQRVAPVLPIARDAEGRPLGAAASPAFVEIPADRLADSNARVRAAAAGR